MPGWPVQVEGPPARSDCRHRRRGAPRPPARRRQFIARRRPRL